MRRAVALVGCALLLASCGSPSKESAQLTDAGQSPGAEVTAVEEPGAEGTAPEESGAGGSGDVAVQLPGLPVGGSGATFTAEDPTQCVEVNLTGDPLPAGVAVTITGVGLPTGFAQAGRACGSLGPCLGGVALTPGGGACAVEVTWDTQSPGGELSVTGASATCLDAGACAEARAAVEASGTQTIPLAVEQDPSQPDSFPSDPPDVDPSVLPPSGEPDPEAPATDTTE